MSLEGSRISELDRALVIAVGLSPDALQPRNASPEG
jgi:hypothetical protein